MGLFHHLFNEPKGTKEEAPALAAEKNTVYAPLKGKVIPLREIGDGVFSESILGQGCGIIPEASTITSPLDGIVCQVAETRHAIGITGSSGIEILIHVGLDTVSMNGKGFTVDIKEGDTVRCGQPLMRFDRKAIAAAGFSDVTAVLVTNTADYQSVELIKTGLCEAAEKIIIVR